MHELARLLAVERRLLELLLGGWRDEGRVPAGQLDQLQLVQLHRSLVVHELAGGLGVADDLLTLTRLIPISHEPIRTILAGHHAALTELAQRLEAETGPQGRPMPALTDFLG